MNCFFKYLLPQLLDYFNNDKSILSLLLPQIICENKVIETDKNRPK